MSKVDFKNRSITFGLESENASVVPFLRIIYSLPRLYTPLLDSWDILYPGSLIWAKELVRLGFIEYQEEILIDTINNSIAKKQSKPVARYKLTNSGKKLYYEAKYDIRVLNDNFTRITTDISVKILKVLEILFDDLENSKVGVSVPYLTKNVIMSERTMRWWVNHLLKKKYIQKLEIKIPDTRVIIPGHYRVTKKLSKQLSEIFKAYSSERNLILEKELKIYRNKYLGIIHEDAIIKNGIADYAHDIGAQKVLACIVKSNSFQQNNVFNIEPRISLSINNRIYPWAFQKNINTNTVFYQPDAEFREKSSSSRYPVRSALEFERYQTRRDSWSHIEKFVGWMYTKAHETESGVLRFVVESEQKARAYVELIEAYADFVYENKEKGPVNSIILAVSTTNRIYNAQDPLHPEVWYKITIEGSKDANPVIHSEKDSPYNLYFARGRK